MIVTQNMQPDQFFSADERDRLQALMAQWRSARNQGMSLRTPDQNELESLVEAELFASAERAKRESD